MLEERPWQRLAALVGSHVTLYHGTNTQAWDRARKTGQIAARTDWEEFANEIEVEFGLQKRSVWLHPASSFTRHSRHHDPHVYLTADPAVAASYASKGSEVIADTLMAAWRLLHPDANPFTPAGKQILNSFVAEWMERHHLAPLVLTLSVPLEDLPIPSGSLLQDPAEWWAAANLFGPAPTVVFPGPIPLAWVVDPALDAPEVAL